MSAKLEVVEVTDENLVTTPPPVNEKRKNISRRGANAEKWSSEDEAALIRIIHEEAKQHAFVAHTIGSKGWKDMAKQFWEETGNSERFDFEAIRQKYNRLRSQWRYFKQLLSSCSDYSWDPESNTVVVDELIWRDHIKKYPQHKQFRYRGLRHCELLSEIFGDGYAIEALALSSVQPQNVHGETTAPESEPDTDTHSEDGGPSDIHVEPTRTNASAEDIPHISQRAGKAKQPMGDSSHKSHRKKPKFGQDDFVECFQQYTEWKRERWEQERAERSDAGHPQSQSKMDPYSPVAVTLHLQKLHAKYEFQNKQFLRALDELKDSTTRQIFMSLSEPLQVVWVNGLGNH